MPGLLVFEPTEVFEGAGATAGLISSLICLCMNKTTL